MWGLGAGPVSGEAIKTSFDAMLKDPAFKLEPIEGGESAWVGASGDLAVTGFAATMTATGDDGKVTSGPILNQTVWKKQEDGSWKFVSDVNAAYPATAQ